MQFDFLTGMIDQLVQRLDAFRKRAAGVADDPDNALEHGGGIRVAIGIGIDGTQARLDPISKPCELGTVQMLNE
jgi:hypothetical protein